MLSISEIRFLSSIPISSRFLQVQDDLSGRRKKDKIRICLTWKEIQIQLSKIYFGPRPVWPDLTKKF